MWTTAVALLALLAFLALVFWLFRLSMGLRWAKVSRENARRDEEARGRRIVAELPTEGGELGFFAEDHAGFYWPGGEAAKPALRGARLLLNGGILAACARPGTALPEPSAPEPFEGRERWEVALYLSDGTRRTVPCGTVREGVSREIARSVFEAAREALGSASSRRTRAASSTAGGPSASWSR